jgi:hypothetical protein
MVKDCPEWGHGLESVTTTVGSSSSSTRRSSMSKHSFPKFTFLDMLGSFWRDNEDGEGDSSRARLKNVLLCDRVRFNVVYSWGARLEKCRNDSLW